MKVVQHRQKLKIKNWCDGGGDKTQCKHEPLFPNAIRCIVCGPSNCGKTNGVFNMLFDANGHQIHTSCVSKTCTYFLNRSFNPYIVCWTILWNHFPIV